MSYKMSYYIKGVTLDESEMRQVYEAYRLECIAENIRFETDVDYDKSMQLAELVVDHMDNNNLTEGEATEVVLCNLYS